MVKVEDGGQGNTNERNKERAPLVLWSSEKRNNAVEENAAEKWAEEKNGRMGRTGLGGKE